VRLDFASFFHLKHPPRVITSIETAMKTSPSLRALLRHPALTATCLIAGPVLASAVMTSAAWAAPYNPGRLPPEQLAEVGQICQSVVGLRSGEAHYVGCVESLSSSWRSLSRSRARAQAREDCLDKGLRLDTPELAQCVLAGPGAARAPVVRVSDAPDGAGPAKSYYLTSPRDVHRREEQSCARLGYDPTSGGFASCVAGLQASLFAADNPMN